MAREINTKHRTSETKKKLKGRKSFPRLSALRALKYRALTAASVLLFLGLCSYFLPQDNFQTARERILKNPNDLEAHLILAEEFLKNNQLEPAKRELMAAKQIGKNPEENKKNIKVLGWTSKIEELWKKYQEENPEELRKLIEKWEKIVSDTPTYRDGYLYLSLYYFKLGNPQKSQENLQKALEIDPNYKIAREIKQLIQHQK